jgi:TRAP-type C4-dicarboxylate transport system permease small subunit
MGLLLIVSPALVGAAGMPSKIVPCDGAACTVCDLATLAQNILNAAIYIAVFLAGVLFAWAGWNYLSAGGEGQKLTSAKNTFTNVFIGLVIILAGWLVVDTLMKTMTNGQFGPWNAVC